MKRYFIGLIFFCLFALSCRIFNLPVGVNLDPALYGQVQNDVTYCVMDGKPQQMDIYYPTSGGPWPVLLQVHGGGWTEGDKSEAAGSRGWTDQGYLLVSINYRMYPADTFPAMIEDVKCAVRSLRTHAAEYNLDPNRIAALGGSAGGHLVALLATSDPTAGWDVGEYLDQSSRVQAVIVMSGPADLTQVYPQQWVNDLIRGVFTDGSDADGVQRLAGSPIHYISPDDAPFLILQGDQDDIVPVEQATILRDHLLAGEVPVKLVIVQNGDHGLNGPDGSASPNWDELARMMIDFLAENLK